MAQLSSIRRLILLIVILTIGSCFHLLSARDFVITLDAGHGGHDYGAVGQISNEKTLTLKAVLQLGKLIENNLQNVKTVYTRTTDEFIPLADRAAIANKANSDLFISIHINSVDMRNRNRSKIEGCQVYTLGLHKTAENLAVAKRENSVMELESDHSEKYSGFDPNSLESDIVFELSLNKRLDQSIELAEAIHGHLSTIAGRIPKGVRQAGFWVLWATSMPSVLVELDFICNPNSEKFMNTEEGMQRMVVSIYNAICAYLNTYASQIVGQQFPEAKTIEINPLCEHATNVMPHNIPSTTDNIASAKALTDLSVDCASDEPEKEYIQILASSVLLNTSSTELKGHSNVCYYKDAGMYKYVIGPFKSPETVITEFNKVKTDFPQAFIVTLKGGTRVGYKKLD